MDADMSALLAARAWSVLTEWKVTSSAGRERIESATWGNIYLIRAREEELGPCGETGRLFTSCITKWQDVQGTWCSSALHTKHIKIRQRFHHVISIDYRPRMVRFGHDHECNPSGVLLAHRRIRRGTSEAS